MMYIQPWMVDRPAWQPVTVSRRINSPVVERVATPDASRCVHWTATLVQVTREHRQSWNTFVSGVSPRREHRGHIRESLFADQSRSSPLEPGVVLLHHTAIHALAVPFGMRNNSTSVSTITVAAEMCGQ